jgi:hypothetical protein
MRDLQVMAIVAALLANARDDWMGSLYGAYAIGSLILDVHMQRKEDVNR